MPTVVTEGQLEVIKASSGREVLLNVLEPVEVVGEMALLEDKPRMASVRARTDSTLLAISKELIEHLLKPESTEGGRRVSVLKRQEGAPVNLG